MNTKQTTIKEPCSISGVGLHTGETVTITFRPAPEDHGIQFSRIDLEGNPTIPADVDYVIDTSRGTTLGRNNVSVNTVEHAMAALAGLEIDNVMVEMDGPELPILDGSSEPFVNELLKAGIVEQQAEREYFEVTHNIHYSIPEDSIEMIAMPLDGYRATVMVDYNSPILGSQHASISDIREFKSEISSSRTFCFLHELEQLVEKNLIKGGDIDNAIVIVDKQVSQEELDHLANLFNKEKVEVKNEGILNNVELRFQNEPARHKLLDLVGDLALIGTPIKAQIMAARPGHKANIEFARKIKSAMIKAKKAKTVPRIDPNVPPIYSAREIKQFLPHDHPFIFVDKIIELSEKHVVGVKNVTMTEDFFRGHFPEEPIMPGVLQIEAMAQVGGVMVLSHIDEPKNYSTLFIKIENAKFKDKVVPGDTMIMRMELVAPIRRGVCAMKGQIFVGDKIVTEAELMAQIVKKG